MDDDSILKMAAYLVVAWILLIVAANVVFN